MAMAMALAIRSPSLHIPHTLAPRIASTILRSSHNLSRHPTRFSRASTPRKPLSARAQHDEESLAKAATETHSPTIFDKILSREIPATVVYETDSVLAFRDINPQAPVHVVLIPKVRDGLTQLSRASEANKEVLGELMYAAKVVAEREGLAKGFRVVVNDGVEGCQSVYHLHLHLLGGRQLKWPPG